MSALNDGGPAFPVLAQEVPMDDAGLVLMNVEASGGMTLRDYFAASAMQGFVTDPELTVGPVGIAEWAYVVADAMLEAREGE